LSAPCQRPRQRLGFTRRWCLAQLQMARDNAAWNGLSPRVLARRRGVFFGTMHAPSTRARRRCPVVRAPTPTSPNAVRAPELTHGGLFGPARPTALSMAGGTAAGDGVPEVVMRCSPGPRATVPPTQQLRQSALVPAREALASPVVVVSGTGAWDVRGSPSASDPGTAAPRNREAPMTLAGSRGRLAA
jgi:hypothetical protein